jgi:rhodanese-related sulfurtransferase
VQATDQWIGTRGARVVLADAEEVRAPATAQWLRQLGHEACVLAGGVATAAPLAGRRSPAAAMPSGPVAIAPAELAPRLGDGSTHLIDLRPSMSYRREHIAGAVWSIRPGIAAAVAGAAADSGRTIVLIADEPGVAGLAALDLAEAGARDVRLLAGGHAAARAAGLRMAATPDTPGDADCIDFLFFTHDRHDGNADAARQYLAWELGLLAQLDADERAVLSVSGAG